VPGLIILGSAVSGILLAPLAFLAVFTGYCMRSPGVTGLITLGLLGDYNLCSVVHNHVVPEVLAVVGSIHALLVSESLYAKYARASRVLRVLLELFRAVSYIVGSLAMSLAAIYLFLY